MPPPGIGTWYDPRINCIDGKYYITYAAVSPDGCRVAIGQTDDFKTVSHISFPFHVENRNAVLFPEKINGEYCMLHRPQRPGGTGNIWFASSPDLKYWGNCRVVARPKSFWECIKIGPGAPPIKTSEGWLIIYHAVFSNCNGYNYGLGAMMLDLEKPWKEISRAEYPIMFVEKDYEMIGQVPNVIFPGAIIPEADGSVKVYYGAADYVQCLAEGQMSDVIDFCMNR
jgi:beta-1,4-mannooligosaccharide/beta-1,4-mannosyl-N-acetylglucosamine phosphorylase